MSESCESCLSYLAEIAASPVQTSFLKEKLQEAKTWLIREETLRTKLAAQTEKMLKKHKEWETNTRTTTTATSTPNNLNLTLITHNKSCEPEDSEKSQLLQSIVEIKRELQAIPHFVNRARDCILGPCGYREAIPIGFIRIPLPPLTAGLGPCYHFYAMSPVVYQRCQYDWICITNHSHFPNVFESEDWESKFMEIHNKWKSMEAQWIKIQPYHELVHSQMDRIHFQLFRGKTWCRENVENPQHAQSAMELFHWVNEWREAIQLWDQHLKRLARFQAKPSMDLRRLVRERVQTLDPRYGQHIDMECEKAEQQKEMVETAPKSQSPSHVPISTSTNLVLLSSSPSSFGSSSASHNKRKLLETIEEESNEKYEDQRPIKVTTTNEASEPPTKQVKVMAKTNDPASRQNIHEAATTDEKNEEEDNAENTEVHKRLRVEAAI